MKNRMKLLLALFLLPLSSCESTGSRGVSAVRTNGNPLIGTWKFDSAASMAYTVNYNSNRVGVAIDAAAARKLIQSMKGSSLRYTDNTIHTTIPNGVIVTSKYSFVSMGPGEIVRLKDFRGDEYILKLAGNNLINEAPDLNIAAVFSKQ